jgi:aspartate/methionine/tyrosine aminotransferase
MSPGDAVLVPNPAYPIHPYGFVIAGADIRHVPLIPGVDFFSELEKAIKDSWPRPRMLVLNFPANPTTQCVELDFFEKVVAIAREHKIWVIHDLAYADLVFDGYTAPSILQVPDAKEVAIESFTLSKSYNMPGWRVGFMCGSPTLIAALGRMKSYLDYGMFTPIQVAAITALEGPQECVSRDSRHVPQAPRRAVRRPERHRLGRRKTQGHHVRLGENPRAVPPRWVPWSSARSYWPRRRWRSPPASVSASTATTMCASA